MERETYQNQLCDAIGLILIPLKDFHDLLDYETEGVTGSIMRVLKELLNRQDEELEKIYEAINRTLGRITLEIPLHGKSVNFGGRKYSHPKIIRAVLKPVKPQVAAQGGVS